MARVIGTREVINKLHRVNAVALGIITDAQLKDLLVKRVLGRFDEGVSPSGSPWPGLLEDTIKRKIRGGYSKPKQPLYRTGALRRSIGVIRGSNEGLLASSTGLGFRIGVRDEDVAVYGRVHNYGIGQVQRRFIGLGATDLRSVQDFIRRRIPRIEKA